MILAVSLMGCGSKAKNTLELGTYISQNGGNQSYPMTISLFEDDTYQFNLVMGSYFTGTYTVEDDQLVLSMDNNASKLMDDVIKELTFTVDFETGEITSMQEIPDYMSVGMVFKQ